MRVPVALLPTWSWFCRNETKLVGGRCQLRLAARGATAVDGGFALVCKPLGERAAKMDDRVRVVAVVAVVLLGHSDMQRVVDVVVPLRREAHFVFRAAERPGRIVVVLEHEMDMAVRHGPPHRRGDLGQDMRRAVVHDRVHGVEPQPVDMVLLQPVKGVVHHEVAHNPAVLSVVVDRRTPRRAVALGEERRRILREIVSLGSEMVVDDIDEHHQPAAVRRLDQKLEVVGLAVAGFGCEQVGAVIAPVEAARRLRKRHQLDRRHAELDQRVELLGDAGVAAAARVNVPTCSS